MYQEVYETEISTKWRQGPYWAARSIIKRQKRIEGGPVWQRECQKPRWLLAGRVGGLVICAIGETQRECLGSAELTIPLGPAIGRSTGLWRTGSETLWPHSHGTERGRTESYFPNHAATSLVPAQNVRFTLTFLQRMVFCLIVISHFIAKKCKTASWSPFLKTFPTPCASCRPHQARRWGTGPTTGSHALTRSACHMSRREDSLQPLTPVMGKKKYFQRPKSIAVWFQFWQQRFKTPT